MAVSNRLITKNLAVAKKLTKNQQVTVLHQSVASRDPYNQPTLGAGVPRQAIVEYKQKMVETPDRQSAMSIARLMFFEGFAVTLDDKFTLPDGTTAPVVAFEGVINPDTSLPYQTSVYLGA